MSKTKVWRLKANEERRFKSGHPWVFSNELQDSPKGIALGEAIELRSASGSFLAHGFGNPQSLIAFRVGSRDAHANVDSQDFFDQKIEEAFRFRRRFFGSETGVDTSFRVVFGEVDGLPGLVIDRYFCVDDQNLNKAVWVVQVHSAAMDVRLDAIKAAILKIEAQAILVLRRDPSVREKEGLKKEVTEVIGARSEDLTHARIRVGDHYQFQVDLVNGQKTGFFLDQYENIQTAVKGWVRYQKSAPRAQSTPHFRSLDLCCYVGHWTVQWAEAALKFGTVDVTLMDASATALALAKTNLELNFKEAVTSGKLKIKTVKGDVFTEIPSGSFDFVVADPPALIKSRKVIPQGKQAYRQLMTEVFQRVKSDGFFIACSCSQLLSREDFMGILSRSARPIRWISEGSTAPDHHHRLEFPESHYLKCWIGIRE